MPIFSIADPEGNASLVEQQLELISQYKQINNLMNENCRIISLGDLNDKEVGEGKIYQILETINAINIAGNRDTNNIRTLTELLSAGNTQNLMRSNSAPYWTDATNTPLKFYREYLNSKTHSDTELVDIYDDESLLEKSWIHSEFINKKTRGAPQRNEFRCKEFGLIFNARQTEDWIKQIVVDSYIADMVTAEEYSQLLEIGLVKTSTFPEGYQIGRTWNYLQKSVLIYRENNTLFCHSGIFEDSYPFLQSGDIVAGCEDSSPLTSTQKLELWINARNTEHLTLINTCKSEMLACALRNETTFGGMPEKSVPVYDIALPGVAHTLQSNDHNKKTALSEEKSAIFINAEINTIIYGHQPTCCATPIVKREYGIAKLATDTALITGENDDPQKRGGSACITVLFEDGKVESFGRLNNKAIRAFYGSEVDLSDPKIGLFISPINDPKIGTTINLNIATHDGDYQEHFYRVNGRLYNTNTNELGDYILVCHETSGPFLFVPEQYGIVRIPAVALEPVALKAQDRRVFEITENCAQLNEINPEHNPEHPHKIKCVK